MRHQCFVGTLLFVLASSSLNAQKQKSEAASEPSKKTPSSTAYFTDPAILNVTRVLAPPPSTDSVTTQTELAVIHGLEQSRTQQQVAAARADDLEQDIFIFRDLVGQDFTALQLPLTAALSRHIHSDESIVTKPLKTIYARARPFQYDSTLKPVCTLTDERSSYPSGHTVSGYLMALTLVQMLPEKQAQIMKRAEDYAHNRIVCGVHYPSDIEAGRDVAYLMFGYMLANPRFQEELSAAREETRSRLGLHAVASNSSVMSDNLK
jgi:acid phosphatase (class A)